MAMARELTKGEAMQLHRDSTGEHACDPAIPQWWVDDVRVVLGREVPIHAMAWCYREIKVGGYPLGLTPEARDLVIDWEQALARL